jgi:hypothetical protein
VTCPYVHRVEHSIYTPKLYVCKCPACAEEIIVPSLGELRTRCLSTAYRACGLYRAATTRDREVPAAEAEWWSSELPR